MISEDLKKNILKSVMEIDPYKVILFGSYASGRPHKDSDIDLFVVTKDDYVPGNFKEKMALKVKVSKAFDSIRKQYPIDLIVYTKRMNDKFLDIGGMFAKEIINRGIVLYEADDERVA